MLTLVELSHFWQMFLALKFEQLDQTGQDFQFSKQRKFLTSGEKSHPSLCFSTCQGESLTKQWTYGPT